MRFVTCALSLLLLGGFASAAQGAHTRAQLLLNEQTARPGDTVLAGVRLQMDPRWHTYWKNSGDSGMPTAVDWQLPKGITAGQIEWPLPEKLYDTNLTTYIYRSEAVLLVPLKIAPDAQPGPLTLTAKLSWLECDALCLPGSGEIQAHLTIGSERKSSTEAATLEQWEQKVPKPAAAVAPAAWWEGQPVGNSRPLVITWAGQDSGGNADFYPDASEQFEVQAATAAVSAGNGRIGIRKQVKKLQGDWPREISGVLVSGSGDQRIGYAAEIRVGATAPKMSAEFPNSAGAAEGARPLWRTLFYALLGGLILNIMPCVLPVISLKILGFVNQAKDDPRKVRRLGLVYTGGVLVSFLLLAAIVIAFNAAGRSVGWGFQFSNPVFLVAMTALVTLIALNLFGVFEVTLGSGALTAASGLSSRHGASGAFFNGLLATVLATSCSAPFLAAAVGVAFTQSPAIAVVTMLTAGIGLALPYLVLSWQPAWLKFLPKPGPWMEKFKIAMGFPMLATAVWLCSLLTIHYGERAWWMPVFLVFLAVAAWVFGEFAQRGTRFRPLAGAVALAILLAGYFYALESQLQWRQPGKETNQQGAPKEEPRGLAWQPWSPEALARARADHRPVIVDFTAKWCPTCNTIVKPTLESAAVQSKLRQINALPLLANYTRQPKAISDELRRFGRAGVPLVLVYPRDQDAPPMVFDLVTPGTLLAALERAGQ